MHTPKHTKGPWVTGAGACHNVYAEKHNGHQQIIAICPTQRGDHDYDSQEVAANAKLIAAAPALLTACRAIVAADNMISGLGWRDDDGPARKQMLAAIEEVRRAIITLY